ncbi:MAG: adenylyl-sulfate kinase [Pseudoclavibacter sp.]
MTESRVLTPDEIDVLELALAGLLPGLPASLRGAGENVLRLVDAENTPLALLDPSGALTAQQPLAPAVGPLADRSIRLGTADAPPPGATAVWLSEPLTIDEEEALVAELGDGATGAVGIVLLVPVARQPRPDTLVHPVGLLAYATSLRERLPEAAVRVVPWPASSEMAPDALDQIVGALGATRRIEPVSQRSSDTVAQLERLGAAYADAVNRLFSPAAARSILASRAHAHPRGRVIFFSGLSGSGKSTVAKALAARLEAEGRAVSLLDGDEVRHHLSKGLGFSREDREANIERIGYVASLVAKHGGLAIAAPIAPFASGRETARRLAEEAGADFHLVWVSTPLEVCEARDRKGLYAKARAGEIPDFTGISSPYEQPDDAEIVIDTSQLSIDDAIAAVAAVIE